MSRQTKGGPFCMLCVVLRQRIGPAESVNGKSEERESRRRRNVCNKASVDAPRLSSIVLRPRMMFFTQTQKKRCFVARSSTVAASVASLSPFNTMKSVSSSYTLCCISRAINPL